MALKHSSGDLLAQAKKGKYDVIVQGCNCFCTMGSGIAKQIREQYSGAYEADKATAAGDRTKLGTYSMYNTRDGFTIVNGYTQYGFNRGTTNDLFEYDAFERLLIQLVDDFPGKKFGFPYIGMGLAGGDKDRIVPMIEDFAEAIEATGGSATLVEFK